MLVRLYRILVLPGLFAGSAVLLFLVHQTTGRVRLSDLFFACSLPLLLLQLTCETNRDSGVAFKIVHLLVAGAGGTLILYFNATSWGVIPLVLGVSLLVWTLPFATTVSRTDGTVGVKTVSPETEKEELLDRNPSNLPRNLSAAFWLAANLTSGLFGLTWVVYLLPLAEEDLPPIGKYALGFVVYGLLMLFWLALYSNLWQFHPRFRSGGEPMDQTILRLMALCGSLPWLVAVLVGNTSIL